MNENKNSRIGPQTILWEPMSYGEPKWLFFKVHT